MRATVIDLYLSVFQLAEFHPRKGAIKLYYLYDHSGSLPALIVITDAKYHEIRVAKSEEKLDFHLLPDNIVSFDRGYLDFKWLHSLEERGIWFVTPAKKNLEYRVTGQHQPI
jgi:hypothetical protein